MGENATTKTITMLAVSFKDLTGLEDAGMMLCEGEVEMYCIKQQAILFTLNLLFTHYLFMYVIVCLFDP